MRARLPSDTRVFDEDRSDLLSLVADWELYVLPDGVIEDEGFARETRLANCLIPTRLLLREAERRGIRARHGAGLLVAPPFGTRCTTGWSSRWTAPGSRPTPCC